MMGAAGSLAGAGSMLPAMVSAHGEAEESRPPWTAGAKFLMSTESLSPDLTLLEVLSRWRRTEAVFHRFEEEAGVCLLCHALFDTLAEAAAKYGVDLDRLLLELRGEVETDVREGK